MRPVKRKEAKKGGQKFEKLQRRKDGKNVKRSTIQGEKRSGVERNGEFPITQNEAEEEKAAAVDACSLPDCG